MATPWLASYRNVSIVGSLFQICSCPFNWVYHVLTHTYHGNLTWPMEYPPYCRWSSSWFFFRIFQCSMFVCVWIALDPSSCYVWIVIPKVPKVHCCRTFWHLPIAAWPGGVAAMASWHKLLRFRPFPTEFIQMRPGTGYIQIGGILQPWQSLFLTQVSTINRCQILNYD